MCIYGRAEVNPSSRLRGLFIVYETMGHVGREDGVGVVVSFCETVSCKLKAEYQWRDEGNVSKSKNLETNFGTSVLEVTYGGRVAQCG